MQNPAIFPLFYLPPISFYSDLKAHQTNFLIEKFEHFPKQTFRNRASIQSPNGILDLTIPVVKGSKMHTKIKDVKISYDSKWQRLHWLSFQNNYRSSAYFEFYEDGLASFYEKKYDFLFDYNLELFQWMNKQLKLNIDVQFTESYETDIDAGLDFRESINKKNAPLIETKPYFQVFSDRNGYINNLSIIDLLFSQGPQAKNYF